MTIPGGIAMIICNDDDDNDWDDEYEGDSDGDWIYDTMMICDSDGDK